MFTQKPEKTHTHSLYLFSIWLQFAVLGLAAWIKANDCVAESCLMWTEWRRRRPTAGSCSHDHHHLCQQQYILCFFIIINLANV